MDQFLGAAVTGLELEQLQAVVMQLSQEIGAERVIEACAAQAALTQASRDGLSALLACPQVCPQRLQRKSHRSLQGSSACATTRPSTTV